jgi:glycerol-3-phosphate cytidylyltransferase
VGLKMKQYNIGLIAGSFDLIHPGYIWMFRDAKDICNKLIIALQGDPTIDRPNKCKPIQSLNDRAEILSSIKYIDQIVTYNTEAELLALLQVTNFDVRILGSDYVGKSYTGDNLNKPIHFHS